MQLIMLIDIWWHNWPDINHYDSGWLVVSFIFTKFAKLMFSQVFVCPQGGGSLSKGDLCPGEGDLCPGEWGLCPGEGGSLSKGGSLSRGGGSLSKGGLCPGEGGICPGEGGLCPGEGVLSKGGGSLSRGGGSLSRGGGSFQGRGVSVQGGLCQEDPLPVTCRQYASYLNASLLRPVYIRCQWLIWNVSTNAWIITDHLGLHPIFGVYHLVY